MWCATFRQQANQIAVLTTDTAGNDWQALVVVYCLLQESGTTTGSIPTELLSVDLT
jgi:hypothetical protein